MFPVPFKHGYNLRIHATVSVFNKNLYLRYYILKKKSSDVPACVTYFDCNLFKVLRMNESTLLSAGKLFSNEVWDTLR